MSYTNREYPVMEIAIAAVNRPDHQNERLIPGDIISVRKPHFVIGTGEGSRVLWMLADGIEQMNWGNLSTSNYDMDISYINPDYSGERFDKRRYYIPFNRLKKVYPSFDINRAVNENDLYQPFITIDFSDSGYWYYLAKQKPLDVHGLVFDKVKGDFL